MPSLPGELSSGDKRHPFLCHSVPGSFLPETQQNEFMLLSAPPSPHIGPMIAFPTFCYYVVIRRLPFCLPD